MKTLVFFIVFGFIAVALIAIIVINVVYRNMKRMREDVEKTELSYTADGNVIWYSDFGKLTVSYKVKHIPTVRSSHFILRCLHKKAFSSVQLLSRVRLFVTP